MNIFLKLLVENSLNVANSILRAFYFVDDKNIA